MYDVSFDADADRATDGDTHLGGDDFDRELIGLFTREIHRQFGVDLATPKIKQQMRLLAENIKKRLSVDETAQVEIEIDSDRVFRRTIERGEFENMIAPLVDKTMVVSAPTDAARWLLQ